MTPEALVNTTPLSPSEARLQFLQYRLDLIEILTARLQELLGEKYLTRNSRDDVQRHLSRYHQVLTSTVSYLENVHSAYLSAPTLGKGNSDLLEEFTRYLSASPLTERQLLCWMAAQDVQGWLPISRIYRDFTESGANLAEYLSNNLDNCAALMRWVKHCSDARWAGVAGLYDSFIDWVAV